MYDDEPGRHPARRRFRALILAAAVAAFAMAAATVYFRVFTGFSIWDDEGYLMAGLRSMLRGLRLYDVIYSQYGPFYYLAQGALYAGLHAEVTHNMVRWIVATLWLLSACLIAWSVCRLTRSLLLTAMGFLLSIRLLEFLAGSPGHPEGLAITLVTGILIIWCHIEERPSRRSVAILFMLIAALALTKVNLGVYAGVAAGLALLRSSRWGVLSKFCYALGGCAALAIPWAILAPLANVEWAQRLSLFAGLSLAAAILAVARCHLPPRMTVRLWLCGVTALAGASALIIGIFVGRGSTLPAMFQMAVLQHMGFAKDWYDGLAIRTLVVPFVSLGLAVIWVLWNAAGRRLEWLLLLLNGLKAALLALWAIFLLSTLRLSILTGPFGWLLYNAAIPFCWLVLTPPAGKRDAGANAAANDLFRRAGLCLFSVLMALCPVPVGGAQVEFAVILVIPIACLFLSDIRETILALAPTSKPVLRAATVFGVLLLVAGYSANLIDGVRTYYRATPLSLRGTGGIRVSAEDAASYQWVTDQLKATCDEHFSLPGIFSIQFWTNTEEPSELMMNNWVAFLTRQQQATVVGDLSRVPRLCVVYSPRRVEFWRRGQDLQQSVLAQHIFENFKVSATRGEFSILVRK